MEELSRQASSSNRFNQEFGLVSNKQYTLQNDHSEKPSRWEPMILFESLLY